jgi:hypothetical protein
MIRHERTCKNLMSASDEHKKSSTEPGMPTQRIVPVCEHLLNSAAANLSKEFVFDVYDKIAPHFSHTRYVFYLTEDITHLQV